MLSNQIIKDIASQVSLVSDLSDDDKTDMIKKVSKSENRSI